MNDPRYHLTDDTLYAWLDGEIQPDEKDRAAGHLAACRACTERLLAVEQLFAGIRAVPPVRLSRDLRPDVMDRIRELPQPAPGRTSPLLRAAAFLQAAAAAVLLLVAGISLAADIEAGAALVLTAVEIWFDSLAGWVVLPEGLPGLFEIQKIDPGEVLNITLSLLPLFIASGALWLVGNGILVLKLRSGAANRNSN